MKTRLSRVVLASGLLVGSILLANIAFLPFHARAASQQASGAAKLTIDYPLSGSIFPPEITPPTLLWHDSSAASDWMIEVSFGGRTPFMRVNSAGEYLQPGELDTRAGTSLEWTQEQQSTHTWKPDDKTWKQIKQLSLHAPATIRITGYADGDAAQPLSTGSVTIFSSPDPVGAPNFYRDVPLMIAPLVGPGAIQPLPPSALPLIEWELRVIGQPRSHTVMENLPTCANCHSFSRDGRTMGLDMDGPRNDKGLYALVSTSKSMTITNRDVLRWASFKEDAGALTFDPTVKRFGFMS